MQYLLLIISDPAAPTYVPEEDNIEEWVADLVARGASVVGNRLRPPSVEERSAAREALGLPEEEKLS